MVLLVAWRGRSRWAWSLDVTGILAHDVSFFGDRSLKEGRPFDWGPAFSVVVLLVVMGVPLCRGGVVWDSRFPPHLG